jgi:hypothetical protein
LFAQTEYARGLFKLFVSSAGWQHYALV